MKFNPLFNLFIAIALYCTPAFSATPILTGTWFLTSVTCLQNQATYSSKGWTLNIDPLYFTSNIRSRCEVKYSFRYQASSKQIQLHGGPATQICNGISTTITVPPMNLDFQVTKDYLSIETQNSYCVGLASYRFLRQVRSIVGRQ